MKRKKAALVACSDPVRSERLGEIQRLSEILRGEGLEVSLIPGFFEGRMCSPCEKAEWVNRCFRDPETDFIFDVSGGDLANFVLPLLDYEAIVRSRAVFYGYSDLTVVLNAIIARTGRSAVNYQIRNLLYDHARKQLRYFRESIMNGNPSGSDLNIRFLRGNQMEGRILGGNIRCFLKLAGTPYMPDLSGAVLLLESMGGNVFKMMTALEQYRQMGVFECISGVLLGTFSAMEKEGLRPTMEELVLQLVPESIPVAKTDLIGHYTSAKAVVLGRETCLAKQ